MDWLSGSKHGEAKRLVSQLADTTKYDRAAAELVHMGVDAVPALVEALNIKDEQLVPLYQQILVRIGKPATPALTRTLGEVHPIVRCYIIDVLAQTKDRAAATALLDALSGEFYTVRTRAALALGQIREPQAIPVLTNALKDNEPDVRAAAARGLGKFADPRTFEAFGTVLLDDPQIKVRQAAAEALGGTKRAEAIPYLMDALRDSFWWYEREQEINVLLDAITEMGNAVVPNLIEALKDPEGTVRKLAASLLTSLPDERAVESLTISLYDTHFDVCRAAAEALAAIGAPALPVLLEALGHPEAWIRQQAILGLTKSHDPQVVPALLNLINDESREVRKQVIQSLGQLQDPRALPALHELAHSRSDRELALLAKQAIQNIQ